MSNILLDDTPFLLMLYNCLSENHRLESIWSMSPHSQVDNFILVLDFKKISLRYLLCNTPFLFMLSQAFPTLRRQGGAQLSSVVRVARKMSLAVEWSTAIFALLTIKVHLFS